MIELFFSTKSLIAIFTLTMLEVVLGIDNLVFISILVGKLPEKNQLMARRVGLLLAVVFRILLVFSLSLLIRLDSPLFKVMGIGFSGKSFLLLGGGLFLIVKSSNEIFKKTEIHEEEEVKGVSSAFGMIIFQVIIFDLIFSLDSMITAIGMVDEIPLIAAAIVISASIMLFSAKPVGDFVNRNPSVKMLALAFLLLIGVLLVAEGTGKELDKGYIYFAMGFSLSVEMLNLRRRNNLETKKKRGKTLRKRKMKELVKTPD